MFSWRSRSRDNSSHIEKTLLVMIVPLIVVLDRYVILKEERYLEEKFGEDYRAYRKRVRRWI